MHPIDELRLSPEATALRYYNGSGKIAVLYCCVTEKKVDKKKEAKIEVRSVSKVVSLVPGSGGDLPKENHEKLGLRMRNQTCIGCPQTNHSTLM